MLYSIDGKQAGRQFSCNEIYVGRICCKRPLKDFKSNQWKQFRFLKRLLISTLLVYTQHFLSIDQLEVNHGYSEFTKLAFQELALSPDN